MRAGQVEFQAVGHRRQDFRDGHEFLETAAENGCQQKPVCGDLERRQRRPRLLRPRIGQSHGIDEAARCVLAVDRLAIPRARLQSDTLGSDHADLGHMVKNVLDNRGGGRDDARGYRERARQRLAKEFHSQSSELTRRWIVRETSCEIIRVWWTLHDLTSLDSSVFARPCALNLDESLF